MGTTSDKSDGSGQLYQHLYESGGPTARYSPTKPVCWYAGFVSRNSTCNDCSARNYFATDPVTLYYLNRG